MTEICWLEQKACDVPAADDWLSASESTRLATLRFPKRREDWRLGRWTAKQTAAAFLSLPSAPGDLAEIEIRPAPSGAPEVFLADRPAPISISLSHRAGTGLCAIGPSDTGFGCDLEVVEPRPFSFCQEYFTPEEQALVVRAAPAERDRLITLLWSAKESILKALRVGLRSSTNAVSVRPVAGGGLQDWRRFYARSSAGRKFDGWWRETDGFLRTVAAGSGVIDRVSFEPVCIASVVHEP